MVLHLAADLQVSGFDCWPADCRPRARSNSLPTGVRTADLYVYGRLPYQLTTVCFDGCGSPDCLISSLPLKKKPELCVSVCLPACPTDSLTDCWPD